MGGGLPLHGIVRNSFPTHHLSQWRGALAQHPDDQFQRYILGGIEQGFRIGFDHSSPLVSTRRNLPSASNQPVVIDCYTSAPV